MIINDSDKKELRNIIKREVAKRGNSVVSEKLKEYRRFKLIRNAFFSFSLISVVYYFILPEVGVTEPLSMDRFAKAIILVLGTFCGGTFLHFLTLTRKETSNLNKEEWFYKTGLVASCFFLIGYLTATVYLAIYSKDPIDRLVVTFVITTVLGYYLILVAIVIHPDYFISRRITQIATFFRIAFLVAALESFLFGIVSEHLPIEQVQNPQVVDYAWWIFSFLALTIIIFDQSNLSKDGELNLAQTHILTFYPYSRIIKYLKSSKKIRKSEIEALEIFLEMEEEGDEHKAKALLVHLSNKYSKKRNGLLIALYSILLFAILSLGEGLIQSVLLDPVKQFFLWIWGLINR